MIYDFSCSDQIKFLAKIFPALGGSGAVLLILAGMSALGAGVQRRWVFRATDIFAGWGIVAAFMTLVAVLLPHALLSAAIIVAVFMLMATFRAVKCGYFIAPFWLLALFPGLMIATAINLTGIYGWDAYSHWVPNALYLFHNNGLPGLDMPASYSVHLGYPYAIAFLTYIASQLAGGFLVQGGAMLNFFFLLAFAEMLAQAGAKGATLWNMKTISLTAFALLAVTLINPSFHASLTLANYADTATMVMVGVLGILFWQLVDVLVQKDCRATRDITVQIALISMAFVLVKQVDFILLGLLVFGFLATACKNKILKSALMQLPLMLIPAIIMCLVWRHYVSVEMKGEGFGVLPLASWHFDLVGPLVRSMVEEALRKNGLFGVALIVIGAGVVSLFKPANSLRNFALLSAIVCAGYIIVLFVTYLGSSFVEGEIREAASFERYATHFGLLEIAVLWIANSQLWARLKEKNKSAFLARTHFFSSPTLRALFVLLVVSVLPLTLLVKSRLIMRGTEPSACLMRDVGRKVALVLPDHARLAVIEPDGDGFLGLATNFELALYEARTGHAAAVVKDNNIINTPASTDLRAQVMEGDNVDAVLIKPATHPQFTVPDFGNKETENGQNPPLLLRKGDGWHFVAY